MDAAASFACSLDTGFGICALSFTLDVTSIINSVADNGCGANAVFIGTTRNTFKDRIVTRLEYQAYSKLALKTMGRIVQDAHASILGNSVSAKIAVHHRLGPVPVGEPSIVIAVSAPHRKEAFVACEHILELVKEKAQIWKREYYENESDDTAEWKANQ